MTVNYPVDGILDLHQFHPKDIPGVVEEYLWECHQKQLKRIRIITGKGKGVVKNRVKKILFERKDVIQVLEGDTATGNWGVLIIFLDLKKKVDFSR